MNELMYNFINQIDDVNKMKEISVEEFIKLVKDNKLISEEDGKSLIESFKKMSVKKNSEDGSEDNDQRKKKYINQHQAGKSIQNVDKRETLTKIEKEDKEKDDDELER